MWVTVSVVVAQHATVFWCLFFSVFWGLIIGSSFAVLGLAKAQLIQKVDNSNTNNFLINLKVLNVE
ncbi:MAG: hypothetical protein AMXMBFR79_10460 [Chitinophagaceae bacterium]